jgi:DNA-binding NtrC family response regulator
MLKKSILVSWIGHTDLLAMLQDLPQAERDRLNEFMKTPGKYGEQPGPIKTALSQGSFSEVHLLSNYHQAFHKPFLKWLKSPAHIHPVEIDSPSDYPTIFQAADGVLGEVSRQSDLSTHNLAILLSPGTPAMAAVWVLLGKSRYPAIFYQTHQGNLIPTKIPYDLVDDFVPQLLRDPDRHFQHLAAQSPSEIEGFEEIIGDSASIRMVVGRAQRAALRDVNVLILGESGTGKEMFARAVHQASYRKNQRFEAVNCAAIPKELLEAELFGHKKGAFTGSLGDRLGAFRRADGGTLFLDELGECDLSMQVKLLRVLQPPPDKGPCCREFYQVGSDEPVISDVRIIAATNSDLVEAIGGGRFREDLYYRLASITLKLPPLRERANDIPQLAQSLLGRINRELRGQKEPGYKDKIISKSTTQFLQSHPWPGNVRQLYNALVQAAVFCDGETIQPPDVSEALAEVPGYRKVDLLSHPLGDGFDLDNYLDETLSHYLKRAMEESDGVKARAAELLGYKNYQKLDQQLKRLDVRPQIPKKAGGKRPK